MVVVVEQYNCGGGVDSSGGGSGSDGGTIKLWKGREIKFSLKICV